MFVKENAYFKNISYYNKGVNYIYYLWWIDSSKEHLFGIHFFYQFNAFLLNKNIIFLKNKNKITDPPPHF